MAEALFEDFLTCPICMDPLKEPVSLGCHHSFCRVCLNNSWASNPSKTCPICRRRSSKKQPDVNFALRELSLSFNEQKDKEPNVAEKAMVEKFCVSHPDVPPLFCVDEDRALCPVCEFSLHSQHTVVSGEVLLQQKHVQTLKDKQQSYEELEKTYVELQRHQNEQSVECVSQISKVFSRLQKILKEEEEKALRSLEEEQSQQAQRLELELLQVRSQVTALTNIIQELQKNNDSQSFKQELALALSLPHPHPQENLLLNQAKVVGNLGYSVLKKMQKEVSFSPVILDPNTAECTMHLSQDLCAVRPGPQRPVPVVPERFTNEAIVLGSQGFSSGQHQWDVEVGDLPTWDIGVVKKSIDRRGQVYTGSRYGIWCLWHGEGEYRNGSGQTIPLKSAPKKIRVKLDYEKGEVAFYDAHTMDLLLILKATFTETLFPYVSVGPAAGAKTKEIRVQSCHGRHRSGHHSAATRL
ncbi:unnamed protein product [Knipowitschia caucasica]|uniref:Uncharacterized protein n=1 Tax=Knipowitschia caucasica TaxID=637954 RepID=A0AAV2MMA6_KNICA